VDTPPDENVVVIVDEVVLVVVMAPTTATALLRNMLNHFGTSVLSFVGEALPANALATSCTS